MFLEPKIKIDDMISLFVFACKNHIRDVSYMYPSNIQHPTRRRARLLGCQGLSQVWPVTWAMKCAANP